jgi:hypothetical protein
MLNVSNNHHHVQHGGSKTRLYKIWSDMKRRCNNPNHLRTRQYVDKGISVCDEWYDFSAFRDWSYSHGYVDDLTIDRINNNGNYCPDNCRWVNRTVQNRNKPNSVIAVDFNGIHYRTITEFCEAFGVPYSRTISRLNAGYTYEDCLKDKVRKRKTKEAIHNSTILFYEYKGQRKTLREWADEFGIKYCTLWKRIRVYGIPFEYAINYSEFKSWKAKSRNRDEFGRFVKC